MSILPKAIYRFDAIPIKIAMTYSTDIEQIFDKIYMDLKKTPNSLSNLEREQQSRRDHNTRYQTLLQGHCNQNNLVLA